MFDSRDIGHRVVVRRVIGERDGRPLLSDALGKLIEVTGTDLTVRTARGPVRVPLSHVYRARRVPDQRRPRGRDIAALELAANAGWPAPVTEPLGDWLLRAADGWTGRANSALPVGDPGLPLVEAVEAVRAWYAARGLTPQINVPLPYAAELDALLAERGWAPQPPVLVQTTTLSDVIAEAPERPDLPTVRLDETPTPEWLAIASGRKGGLPDAAHRVLTGVDPRCFAGVYDGDRLVAIARGAVTAGWLGIGLVEVVPEARRRGLAQHVIAALARWAREVGATRAYLQVEQRNEAAVALYAKLGFLTHHTYLSRRPV